MCAQAVNSTSNMTAVSVADSPKGGVLCCALNAIPTNDQGGSFPSVGKAVPDSAKRVEDFVVQDENKVLHEDVRNELNKQGVKEPSFSGEDLVKAATTVANQYIKNGCFKEAVMVLDLYPTSSPFPYIRIVNIIKRNGGVEKALEFADQIPAERGKNKLLVEIAKAYLAEGNIEKGKAVVASIRSYPERDQGEDLLEKKYTELLEAHVIKGEFNEAMKSVPLIRDQVYAVGLIVEELIENNRIIEARDYLNQQTDPNIKKEVAELLQLSWLEEEISIQKESTTNVTLPSYEESKQRATKILNKMNIQVTDQKLGNGSSGVVYEGMEGKKPLAVKFIFSPEKEKFELNKGEGLALLLPKKSGFHTVKGIVVYNIETQNYNYVDRSNAQKFASDEYRVVAVVSKKCTGPLEHVRLTREEWIELACQLVQGVRTLAQLGLAHHDLHEGNVLIAYPKDGKPTRYKISDFGRTSRCRDKFGFAQDWEFLTKLLRNVITESKGSFDPEDPEIQSFISAISSGEESKVLNHLFIRSRRLATL